jgi:hypothetical protein
MPDQWEDTILDSGLDDATIVSDDWSRWLATNLMLGASESQLVEIMANDGVPEPVVWAEIGRLDMDPCVEAGRWIGERLRKLESLLAILEELRDLTPSSRKIERRRRISPAEFHLNYNANNRPVVLLDLATPGPLGTGPRSHCRA